MGDPSLRKSTLVLLITLVIGVLLVAQNSGPAKAASAPAVPHVAGLPPAAQQAMAAVDPEKIRAQVKFLASDLLEGRGTGARGGDIAAEYIATQFSLYGLEPAGDNGTYMQKVPMIGIATQDDSTLSFVPNSGSPIDLTYRADFVASDDTGKPTSTIDDGIVWMGYGIDAPEFNWNDYKDVDVKGFPDQTTGDDAGLKREAHGGREYRGCSKRSQQADQGGFANSNTSLRYRKKRRKFSQRPGKKPDTERNMKPGDLSEPVVYAHLRDLQDHTQSEAEEHPARAAIHRSNTAAELCHDAPDFEGEPSRRHHEQQRQAEGSRNGEDRGNGPKSFVGVIVERPGQKQCADDRDRQEADHVLDTVHQAAQHDGSAGARKKKRHAAPDQIAADQRGKEDIAEKSPIIAARRLRKLQPCASQVNQQTPLYYPQEVQRQICAEHSQPENGRDAPDRGPHLTVREVREQQRQNQRAAAEPKIWGSPKFTLGGGSGLANSGSQWDHQFRGHKFKLRGESFRFRCRSANAGTIRTRQPPGKTFHPLP